MITKLQVETRSSIIEQYDDEILKVARKQGVEMKVEDLDEIASVYKDLLQNRPPKLLVILDEECNSDVSLMEKMGNSERQLLKKAEALVVSSLGKRLEANFYIRRYKPNYPVAIFTDEMEGLAWLKSID